MIYPLLLLPVRECVIRHLPLPRPNRCVEVLAMETDPVPFYPEFPRHAPEPYTRIVPSDKRFRHNTCFSRIFLQSEQIAKESLSRNCGISTGNPADRPLARCEASRVIAFPSCQMRTMAGVLNERARHKSRGRKNPFVRSRVALLARLRSARGSRILYHDLHRHRSVPAVSSPPGAATVSGDSEPCPTRNQALS